jgi:acyl carrier protein
MVSHGSQPNTGVVPKAGRGTMIQTIRRAIDTKGNLRIPARDLAPRVNLYAAGLTPLAAIEVMIEIEQELRIVFPDQMLVRDSVASIEKIASCLSEVLADGAQPLAAAYAKAA